MSYGIKTVNSKGITIIDTERPVLALSPTSEYVEATDSSTWADGMYFPPPKGGQFPAVFVGTGINQIKLGKLEGIGDYGGATYSRPGWFGLNGNTDMGTREFKYVVINDKNPKGSGGYGLEIYDSTGTKIYRFSDQVLSVSDVIVGIRNQTVTFPNNVWLCPLVIWDGSAPGYIFKPLLDRVGTSNTWDVELEQGSGSDFPAIFFVTFTV